MMAILKSFSASKAKVIRRDARLGYLSGSVATELVCGNYEPHRRQSQKPIKNRDYSQTEGRQELLTRKSADGK